MRISLQLPSLRMRQKIGARLARWRRGPQPGGTAVYWEERYRSGGNSGAGSYGELATFKADVLNRLVAAEGIASVVELGCGDGNQLSLAKYPRYVGYDVSPAAVQLCRARFAGDQTKTFELYRPRRRSRLKAAAADMAISLDVIYHLLDDAVFERYMSDLFGLGRRFVVVYSSDAEIPDPAGHVRHRSFSPWVQQKQPGWELLRKVANPFAGVDPSAVADFYIFGRR